MNAMVKYSIENFKELLEELARTNKPEYLFELEDMIIGELTRILSTDTPALARQKILAIKQKMLAEMHSEPNVKPLLRSFQTSIEGAISSALQCI
ncbi:MAG: hypothetical protein KKH83_02085 [Candidatus Margulisbacteria bacterium]|nr:hypothetical protein [Candidatus Margulisiibacteriota bacterium]